MWTKVPALTKDEITQTERVLRKKARFLVDENIGKLAEVLRDLGWDAVSAQEAGLKGHSDEDLYALGWKAKRIVVTNDSDFLDDRRFPFSRCPGVMILPSPSGGITGFADALATALLVVGRYSEAFNREKTIIGADGTLRIRGFSKERGLHWEGLFRVDKHGQVWQSDAEDS